jgi:hypothetical protein
MILVGCFMASHRSLLKVKAAKGLGDYTLNTLLTVPFN